MLPALSYVGVMGKVEIIAELPQLHAEDRLQVFKRLCELQEDDLLRGIGPTVAEKKLLDEALAEFERDGHRGTPWTEVMRRVRGSTSE
jgi:hypothetical protein